MKKERAIGGREILLGGFIGLMGFLALGKSKSESASLVLKIFPVDSSGRVNFSDSFSMPRPNGRSHEGIDIFATEGTPIYAVQDGIVQFGEDPLGGHVAHLRMPSRAYFYYAHMQGFEGADRTVKAGDVIGYVGTTGNASGGPAHLHFEAHPDGTSRGFVDPYPALTAVAPHGSYT